MNDNDFLKLYDILTKYQESLTDEESVIYNKLGIIVEQINLSHEYRDKVRELNKRLQGCDEDVK